MAEKTRFDLKVKFSDGEKPTGSDFGNLIDSVPVKLDDRFTISDEGDITIGDGLQIGKVNLANQSVILSANNAEN